MARKTHDDSMEKLLKALRERSKKAHKVNQGDVSSADKIATNDTAKAVIKDIDCALWKMKGESGLTYNFHGFSALRKWTLNLGNTSKAVISLDGTTWKRYNAVIRHLKSGLTLAQAFAKARPVKIK